jgi:hypothetical protein
LKILTDDEISGEEFSSATKHNDTTRRIKKYLKQGNSSGINSENRISEIASAKSS